MKKAVKKLTLAKETLRMLETDKALTKIQGGGTERCTFSCDLNCKLELITYEYCA